MKLPEFKLLKLIRAGWEILREDLETQTDERKTMLWELLNEDGSIDNYNFFHQAKSILLREEDDPKQLIIDMMYNAKMNRYPNVYLQVNSEREANNAMQYGEDNETFMQSGDVLMVQQHRIMNSSCSIAIVADNPNELDVLYAVFKLIVIGLFDSLGVLGFMNIKLGGNSIQLEKDISPKAFLKSMSISFDYELRGISFTRHLYARNIFAQGTPTTE